MGLTNRIFTRIATHETVAVPQSAFMMDMSQVASMLRHASPRCWQQSRARHDRRMLYTFAIATGICS